MKDLSGAEFLLPAAAAALLLLYCCFTAALLLHYICSLMLSLLRFLVRRAENVLFTLVLVALDDAVVVIDAPAPTRVSSGL